MTTRRASAWCAGRRTPSTGLVAAARAEGVLGRCCRSGRASTRRCSGRTWRRSVPPPRVSGCGRRGAGVVGDHGVTLSGGRSRGAGTVRPAPGRARRLPANGGGHVRQRFPRVPGAGCRAARLARRGHAARQGSPGRGGGQRAPARTGAVAPGGHGTVGGRAGTGPVADPAAQARRPAGSRLGPGVAGRADPQGTRRGPHRPHRTVRTGQPGRPLSPGGRAVRTAAGHGEQRRHDAGRPATRDARRSSWRHVTVSADMPYLARPLLLPAARGLARPGRPLAGRAGDHADRAHDGVRRTGRARPHGGRRARRAAGPLGQRDPGRGRPGQRAAGRPGPDDRDPGGLRARHRGTGRHVPGRRRRRRRIRRPSGHPRSPPPSSTPTAGCSTGRVSRA